MDDTLERIYDLSYSGFFKDVDDFLNGSNGELDNRIYKEKANDLKFNDDTMTMICETSLEMAKEYFDYIKSFSSTFDATDSELLLYSAWKISSLIKNEIDKEYNNMFNNDSSDYTYLSEIINIYNNTMSK